MENVVCRNVPLFAAYRESGRQVAGPSGIFQVKTFSHGLHYEDIGAVPAIQDVYETTPLSALPEPVKSDILDLPTMDKWVDITSLGARGDGAADNTEVLRKAIAEHRAIYFPAGQYRVTDTITLKPDTVLIGLHPSVTRIFLADSTPAFQGVGSPKPLPHLFASNDFSRLLQQLRQDAKRLTRQPHPHSVFAQFSSGRVYLEDAKAKNARGRCGFRFRHSYDSQRLRPLRSCTIEMVTSELKLNPI